MLKLHIRHKELTKLLFEGEDLIKGRYAEDVSYLILVKRLLALGYAVIGDKKSR